MDSNYTSLMARRVRRILLVCNNYDSFALEEDGRIDVQIAQEYLELNLSNPPAIVRAETTREAIRLINDANDANGVFDLILVVYSAGGNEVWDFAKEAKGILPDCPIVLPRSSDSILGQEKLHSITDAPASSHFAASSDHSFSFCPMIEAMITLEGNSFLSCLKICIFSSTL